MDETLLEYYAGAEFLPVHSVPEGQVYDDAGRPLLVDESATLQEAV